MTRGPLLTVSVQIVWLSTTGLDWVCRADARDACEEGPFDSKAGSAIRILALAAGITSQVMTPINIRGSTRNGHCRDSRRIRFASNIMPMLLSSFLLEANNGA